MPYPVLSAKAAEKFLQARDAGEEIEQFVLWRDSEDSFSDADALALRNALAELRLGFPAAIKPKSRDAGDFEAAAGPIIHQHMGDGQYCADPEFWIWLAVVHFVDLISWRYGDDLKIANLGIGASTENFMYRLWLRAELVIDPNLEDRYELARRGSSLDFWRSHLFRQSYANARPFARAFLRFQYPHEPDKPRLATNYVRLLAKRLARLKSNLFVACLNEDEALRLIEMEAQYAVSELGKGLG